MQATRGFHGGFLAAMTRAAVAGRYRSAAARMADERLEFGWIQPAHHAAERFFGASHRLAAEVSMNALGRGATFRHGLD